MPEHAKTTGTTRTFLETLFETICPCGMYNEWHPRDLHVSVYVRECPKKNHAGKAPGPFMHERFWWSHVDMFLFLSTYIVSPQSGWSPSFRTIQRQTRMAINRFEKVFVERKYQNVIIKIMAAWCSDVEHNKHFADIQLQLKKSTKHQFLG